MLHKCANPACSNPFRRLSEGKLFQVETEYLAPAGNDRKIQSHLGRLPRRVEHFWLCNQCSSFLTLTFEKGRGMITVPLPDVGARKTVTAVELGDLRPSQDALEAVGMRSEHQG